MAAQRELNATTEELFAILLAAAVHDVEHPGKNNAFQINNQTELAMVYNDLSVLENKHASHAFRKMFEGTSSGNADSVTDLTSSTSRSLNVLRNVASTRLPGIRTKVIDAILHTDMSKHFQLVNSIKGMLLNTDSVGTMNSENRWKLLVYMMHVADISGTSRPNPMFIEWTDRCYEEFFQQGDREVELGLPISPLCDRFNTKIPESQVGFISFVVLPCLETLAIAIPAMEHHILPVIRDNKDHWESKQERKPEEEKERQEQAV